ncbi:SMI1/KNR4 family protein [Dactylosporangium sp. NPDC049525]|uniref:SMI1/KNR4 family protein n=1 Tax=Dactylosporangium sp. NPDC049525 TaxID=3154730 RepID=UPI00342CF40D
MSITIALVGLERWLRAHTPATAATLAPATTLDRLDAAASTFGRPLPADVQRLYLWHDGTVAALDRFEIHPSHYFLPLAVAVDDWAFLNRVEADRLAEDPDYRYWQPHWFPIASDGGGDHVMVETAGQHRGRVFVRSSENGPEPERGWPSLDAWADNLMDALTTDALFAGRWRRVPNSPALQWNYAGD